ncbi:mechanosensitive ion channel domain-containing protein [Roseovarius sp.]|uniref:mechanosensitive ion channel domain-containing protein n=1 Tax=Roseovarius sp. TaxID=1486281 RepID=UPI003A96CB2F
MVRYFASFLVALFLTVSAVPAQQSRAAPSDTSAQQTSVDLLIGVIENEATRTELIDRLRAVGVSDTATLGEEVSATLTQGEAPSEDLSLGRRVALITQAAAEDIAGWTARLSREIARAPEVFDGLSGGEASVLLDALAELALVIASTVAAFFVLRGLGKSLYARMSASARDGGMARAVMLFIMSAVIDGLIVLVAWAAGYVLVILALGEFGQIGIRQTLYLNAFLLVEMAKVAVRLVLSPSATSLRPLPITDRAASYLSSRINLIVGVVGYGQLLIVPIINSNVSYAAGRAVSALIAFVVLTFAIWLVLRNRKIVTEWMLGAHGDDGTRRQGALAYLSRHWHWPVVGYLLAMFVIVLLRPGNAVFQTFLASGQVLVVGLLGFSVAGFLSRAMVRGVMLPAGVSARVPLLQARLNTFVPKMLFALRALIFGLVMLLALNAIGLIDLRAWMVSQFGLRLTGTILSVALVLLVSFGLWLGLTSWVDYRLNPEFGSVATAREKTLLTLLRNAATIALVVITLMFVLSEVGLDIAPLLASAGVLGLAIGFGAQKMVQDIITGIFIQFENAMNVGDVVTVGGVTGTVERLTIRSVSLRDVQGAYHIIPFSSVDMVSNYVKDYGYFVCDMGVAYREDIDEAKQAMLDAFAELKGDPEQANGILDELEWFGVNSFGDSAVMLRARIKCVPGRQWGIGRAYNGVLKTVFDARNIEIPFPHQTIYFGESKDGKTQSVKVDLENQKEGNDPLGGRTALG